MFMTLEMYPALDTVGCPRYVTCCGKAGLVQARCWPGGHRLGTNGGVVMQCHAVSRRVTPRSNAVLITHSSLGPRHCCDHWSGPAQVIHKPSLLVFKHIFHHFAHVNNSLQPKMRGCWAPNYQIQPSFWSTSYTTHKMPEARSFLLWNISVSNCAGMRSHEKWPLFGQYVVGRHSSQISSWEIKPVQYTLSTQTQFYCDLIIKMVQFYSPQKRGGNTLVAGPYLEWSDVRGAHFYVLLHVVFITKITNIFWLYGSQVIMGMIWNSDQPISQCVTIRIPPNWKQNTVMAMINSEIFLNTDPIKIFYGSGQP